MLAVLLLAGVPGVPGTGTPAQDRLDAALARFWAAEAHAEVESAVGRILALEPELDDVLARLRAGRPYTDDAPRGRLLRTHVIDGKPHPYLILAPAVYDPARKWPVRDARAALEAL
jgi:hypothetical protein